MTYRKLGNTVLSVSETAFGSWPTFANQVDVDRIDELFPGPRSLSAT